MIVLAAGVALASAAALSGLIWRRRARSRARALSLPAPSPGVTPPRDVLAGAPCQLGDVLMTRSGAEAWIVGAVVLHEDGPSAVLYRAPEAGGDRFVYVRLDRADTWWWLAEGAAPSMLPTGDLPRTLELGSELLERSRSLAFRARRAGELPWPVDDVVVVAEYEGVGSARLLVLRGVGSGLVFAGDAIDRGAVEIVPSGARGLEPG